MEFTFFIKPYQMALEVEMEFPASPNGMTCQSEKLQIHSTFEAA
jgi:hypothetical protein